LKSLATLGTSQGVAQAAMWRVCNDVPFEVMRAQATKVVNVHEIALAARFVEALDGSGDSELVDASYLSESRLFVKVQGEGALAGDAERLAEGLDGLHLLGLPVRVVRDQDSPTASVPALFVNVTLTSSQTGETRGRVTLSRASREEGWALLGKTTFAEGSTVSVLDGAGLARTLDRAIASAFVTAKIARRGTGSTTLKVENHLPFTLSAITLKAKGSSGSPAVPYKGVGIGPARSAMLPIQAAGGIVDRIELNGL
jgi:hypothetical protein